MRRCVRAAVQALQPRPARVFGASLPARSYRASIGADGMGEHTPKNEGRELTMQGILDLVTSTFRGDTLERLSSHLNESPAALERGIAQAAPVALAALADHAQSEPGASGLLAQIRAGQYPQLKPSNVGQLMSEPNEIKRTLQSSSDFLGGLFGNKLSSMVELLSGSSGLSRSSATTLLGLVTPITLGWVGSKVESGGLDASGLSRLLGGEATKLSSHLPAGFSSIFRSLGGVFSFSRQPGGSPDSAGVLRVARARAGLPWLAGAAALCTAVAWFSLRRPTHIDAPASQAEATPAAQLTYPATPDPESALAEAERQPVAGSDAELVILRENAAPFEAYFSGDSPLPQRFLLDDVHFSSGSAELSPNAVLDQVADTLAAHSGARVRIEGYADTQGNSQDNEKLSQQRADVVRTYLVSKGASEGQISALGMSAHHPVAGNDTSTGRAQNRRVELMVIQR